MRTLDWKDYNNAEEFIAKLMVKKANLEEEIKKLKSDTEHTIKFNNKIIGELKLENKKLKSDLSLVIKERDDNIKQNKKLSEKNGQLKSDLAFKNTMLDNVSAEYGSSQDVIRKLKERIRFLEQCLDNKEKVNKSLREENKRLSDFLECEA